MKLICNFLVVERVNNDKVRKLFQGYMKQNVPSLKPF